MSELEFEPSRRGIVDRTAVLSTILGKVLFGIIGVCLACVVIRYRPQITLYRLINID